MNKRAVQSKSLAKKVAVHNEEDRDDEVKEWYYFKDLR